MVVDIDYLLENEGENESITTCNGGVSFGRLCEAIVSNKFGICDGDGTTECIVNHQNQCVNDIGQSLGDCQPIDVEYSNYSYGLCEQYPIPNFLNFSDYGELHDQFLLDTGYNRLHSYIHFEPDYDSVGNKTVRIGIRDTGLDEDGNFSQIRTGYSKFKIKINDFDD